VCYVMPGYLATALGLVCFAFQVLSAVHIHTFVSNNSAAAGRGGVGAGAGGLTGVGGDSGVNGGGRVGPHRRRGLRRTSGTGEQGGRRLEGGPRRRRTAGAPGQRCGIQSRGWGRRARVGRGKGQSVERSKRSEPSIVYLMVVIFVCGRFLFHT
jgi:hypothetical protein